MITQGLDIVGKRAVDGASDWLFFACIIGIPSSFCVVGCVFIMVVSVNLTSKTKGQIYYKYTAYHTSKRW